MGITACSNTFSSPGTERRAPTLPTSSAHCWYHGWRAGCTELWPGNPEICCTPSGRDKPVMERQYMHQKINTDPLPFFRPLAKTNISETKKSKSGTPQEKLHVTHFQRSRFSKMADADKPPWLLQQPRIQRFSSVHSGLPPQPGWDVPWWFICPPGHTWTALWHFLGPSPRLTPRISKLGRHVPVSGKWVRDSGTAAVWKRWSGSALPYWKSCDPGWRAPEQRGKTSQCTTNSSWKVRNPSHPTATPMFLFT